MVNVSVGFLELTYFINYNVMHYIPIKTRVMQPPQDDLYAVLEESLTNVQNGDIVLITSKVVAIHQGRSCLVATTDKQSLVRSEAEAWIEGHTDYVSSPLCIKYGALFYGAGIDASNSGEYYTLLPADPYLAATELHTWLCQHFGITDVGVVITDSHSLPLRRGVLSISIGCHGFIPVDSHVGKRDLFGRLLQFSATNIADAVAAGATAVCGEADESTPIVIARDVPNVTFTTRDISEDILIPAEEDIYEPLLRPFYR